MNLGITIQIGPENCGAILEEVEKCMAPVNMAGWCRHWLESHPEAFASLDHNKAPNILKDVDGEWGTERGYGAVTCHTRMVGGVLCRWWGEDPPPSGVYLINSAIELRAAQDIAKSSVQQPAARLTKPGA